MIYNVIFSFCISASWSIWDYDPSLYTNPVENPNLEASLNSEGFRPTRTSSNYRRLSDSEISVDSGRQTGEGRENIQHQQQGIN